MNVRRVMVAAAVALAVASLGAAGEEPVRAIPLSQLRSGKDFVSAETRAQQADLTVNPGMLWVEQGQRLWQEGTGPAGQSCATCHGEPTSLAGVATRYPIYDGGAQKVLTLEGRIQQCRAERQRADPLAYESQSLLALTALVAYQSRGLRMRVDIDGPARSSFEIGRRLYYEQQGQFNISCAQCHEQNWGKRLRTERISQGHPNGYPAYRLEWQTMGSLNRRLRACFQGVRAEPFASGSAELVALELYLAWRGEGLAIETPAVRR
ncbi:MAG TPA: sulfur oxidation c-type cytochrome SoxA [Gemmataceae bacterium]|nr:sulfur oxidation c-type cytochrome SoxA [Gemmataceae bacterium]